MIDPQVVMDKIRDLKTADEIALFLKDQGIKAWRGNSSACAISKWIRDTTGCQTSTSEKDTWIWVLDEMNHEQELKFLHTRAIFDFVNKFDRGFYPELEAELDTEIPM